MLLLFLGVMAFTVDAGFWLLDRRGGQNQVDASVLAGAQELPAPPDALVPAANAAQDWLERNSRTDQGQVISECGMDEDDDYDLLESPASAPESDFAFADKDDDGLYDTIRACIRREGLVIFARLFDLVGVTIPAVAAAGVQTEDQPSRYALMAMNDEDCSLLTNDQGTLTVHGGGSDVGHVTLAGEGASYTALDCEDDETLLVTGNMTFTAQNHDYCGEAGTNGSNAVLEGELNDDICGLPDPWLNEEQPVPNPTCVQPAQLVPPQTDFSFSSGDHVELIPGTYCQMVQISGPDAVSTTVTMPPGTYIFTGGLVATGGTLTGTEVVLYFTCDNVSASCEDSVLSRPASTSGAGCSSPATFCVQGQAALNLTGPGVAPNIVIWVDRTAVVSAPGEVLLRIAGQGDVDVGGHIYVWAGEIEIQGTAGTFSFEQNGTTLGDTIDIGGQGVYTVTWDENFPPPFVITFIALVE
jgi:hypothetical protein